MTSRWAVLALLCLARMSMGPHLQAVAAIAPFLITDLGFSYAEVGLLTGCSCSPAPSSPCPEPW